MFGWGRAREHMGSSFPVMAHMAYAQVPELIRPELIAPGLMIRLFA